MRLDHLLSRESTKAEMLEFTARSISKKSKDGLLSNGTQVPIKRERAQIRIDCLL